MKTSILKRGEALVLAICLALFAFSASAELQTQSDTNRLAAASTNTFILYGDVTGSYTNGQVPGGASLINATRSTTLHCAVGGFFTNTTANASNVVFDIAQSLDNANWTNNALSVTVVVPGSSTNWAVTHFHVTAPYPIYGLRGIRNANAAGVTGRDCYFKAFPKTGL